MLDKLCPWEAPKYFIFSENVPTLLFYSHFSAIICALIVGGFIFYNRKKNSSAAYLFSLLSLFSVWSLIDVIIWATNRSDVVLFWWSLIILLEPVLYILALYLAYSFLIGKLPNFWLHITTCVLLTPLILLVPTDLNLSGINLYDCDAVEGPLALYYTYLLEIFSIAGIVALTIKASYKKPVQEKRKNLFFTLGLIAFLIAFTSGNIIGSITGNWDIAQYGLFGMPIFIGFLAYLIVQFKVYNLNIIGSQALIVTLWILIGSILFVAQSTSTQIVAGFTLFAAMVLGYILVDSVKKTVKQKEEIERLAKTLEAANEKLKVLDKMKSEFVSIASHQLRSPLTAIRGYSSMLLEGSFGPLPVKAKEAVERINDASKFMASSVEDYLNVSRIQAGNMKYEYSDFNLKDVAEGLTNDVRQVAIKKGLLVTFKSELAKKGIVHADIGKTRQAIDNLMNNALKYTPKGSISIFVHDETKKIMVDISDTGIGMSQRTAENIFGKFERADNANEVNVTGTGLGLYIARKMIREMGGDITAHSEGEGKGSRFRIELPLMM